MKTVDHRALIAKQVKEFRKKNRVSRVREAVTKEREFQDVKWGSIDTAGHTLGDWLHIAEAELNEAKTALIKGGSGRNSIRSEMIQTMAVLQAALEQHGVDDDDTGRKV
jgi:hypothetical protein